MTALPSVGAKIISYQAPKGSGYTTFTERWPFWASRCRPKSNPQTARCAPPKNLLEEVLFDRRRDLFTEVELVFFDTTSLYFEGQGGESLG